jgi:hypothetical protein
MSFPAARNLTLGGRNEREEKVVTDAILTGRANSVYIPIVGAIDQRLMSRFLAKIALEVLTQRIIHVRQIPVCMRTCNAISRLLGRVFFWLSDPRHGLAAR